MVDNVVAVVDKALAKQGATTVSLERWKAEMPSEAEMVPRDKYTIFDRKVRGYRKGIHSEFFSVFFCSVALVGIEGFGAVGKGGEAVG